MTTEKPTQVEMDYLHDVAIADNWLKNPDVPKRSAADACASHYADSEGFLMLLASRGTAGHERFGLNQIRNLAVQYLADRAKILPSSCSLSHPEIRYQGAECPLCEANQSRHEAVKRWEAVALELEQERDAARADLSRPSSDPGAGEVGK